MFTQAVIALGGKGSRLKSLTGEIPKVLFPILGISPFERCCIELKRNGIKKIILSLGYKSNLFEKEITFISNKYNLNIKTFTEKFPLGECGALWNFKDYLEDNFLFLNGDLVFMMDLQRLFKYHENLKSNFTLVSHTTTHFNDSDLIIASNGSKIDVLIEKGFKNQTTFKESIAYLGNAGIACISKKMIKNLAPPKDIYKSSIFNYLAKENFNLGQKIFTYNTSEFIKDMGTEKRFKEVSESIKNKELEKRCYSFEQKALFLDRDNTLIHCPKGEYIVKKSDLSLIKKNIDGIAKLAPNYTLIALITNQPQISMGLLNIFDLDQINALLIKKCLEKNLKIDLVNYCPHHPHSGFSGEIKELKKYCFCRKPLPGMIFELSFLRNINLKKSLIIGDSFRDKKLAFNAGVDFKDVKDL